MLTECSCMVQRRVAFVSNMAPHQVVQPFQEQVVGIFIWIAGLLRPKGDAITVHVIVSCTNIFLNVLGFKKLFIDYLYKNLAQ